MAPSGPASSADWKSPVTSPPPAQAASHRASSPWVATVSQPWSSPSGGGDRAIHSASNTGVSPGGARSRRAKLSLIENGRDGSWVAVASDAVTSGLTVIAFGENGRGGAGLIHSRPPNSPG